MRSHARVTSKNKTVGEMDLGISQLFRFYSILSVQIKCYGIGSNNKPGKLSGITVYVICRCFLLCHILAKLVPQEQLKNEAVVLVRRATGFVQASVIEGQETDLLPLLRTCENYSKAPYVVVCCFGSSYQ